ncbi:hypothetical protein [Daejeonella sp. JGW-45]|uniref:hypothetical protein n=1 Tax=Daejeonella sp. JGW-45 TaxID=3034148 RepID=UPI0023EBD7B5|nr:hypothetical protein [Daejeonella sp. JGW-45]
MEITISRWRLEPRTSADVRILTFLFTTDAPEVPEQIAKIVLSGSLMTELGDYLNEQYETEAFVLQLAKLAAALLKRELEINPEAIYNPDLKFGYITDNFPFGGVEIPDIDTLQNWKFTI